MIANLPPLPELPTVARLYYTRRGARRYKRASTRSGPGEALCFVSLAAEYLRRQSALHATALAAQAAELERATRLLFKSDERNDALVAELEALRADAERYRFLRDKAWGKDGAIALLPANEMDAAVDAARAALKEQTL